MPRPKKTMPQTTRKPRVPIIHRYPDGQEVVVGSKSVAEIAVKALEDACLSEYRGEDVYLAGSNNLTAAIFTLAQDAANGDPSARRELIDRIIGQPTQKIESKSQNLTLVGFLNQIAEADEDE